MSSQITLSEFSLKINDKTVQANYTQYHRKEIHSRAKYVLFCVILASFCRILYLITEEKLKFSISAEELYIIIALVVPSLCLALSFWLGNKSLKFAELHGPALFGSLTLLTIIFNLLHQEDLPMNLIYM